MIRKRNPLDENMTFGEGIPIDMPYNTEYRVLPSQYYPMVQPMSCAFIKDKFHEDTNKQSETGAEKAF